MFIKLLLFGLFLFIFLNGILLITESNFFLHNLLKNMFFKRGFVMLTYAVTLFSSANILCVRFETMLSLCIMLVF